MLKCVSQVLSIYTKRQKSTYLLKDIKRLKEVLGGGGESSLAKDRSKGMIERFKSQVWFKPQRKGIHIIKSFRISMAVQAKIEDKRFTNLSACKTLVKKLKAANHAQLCSTIIGITGHTNKLSLDAMNKAVRMNNSCFPQS